MANQMEVRREMVICVDLYLIGGKAMDCRHAHLRSPNICSYCTFAKSLRRGYSAGAAWTSLLPALATRHPSIAATARIVAEI